MPYVFIFWEQNYFYFRGECTFSVIPLLDGSNMKKMWTAVMWFKVGSVVVTCVDGIKTSDSVISGQYSE